MNREELQKISATCDIEGKFLGYYLSKRSLDNIAQNCGCADEAGNYIAAKLENFFDIQINYIDNNSNYDDCEIIF